MPRTIPAPHERLMRHLGDMSAGMRGLQSQQQNDYATLTGQVVMHTGVLQQYPTSGTNYSSGVGQEVLQNGSGSAPAMRTGMITWTSPSGGTVTFYGACFMDKNGLIRVLLGVPLPGGSTSGGAGVYNTSGVLLGNIPYFSGSTFAGDISY